MQYPTTAVQGVGETNVIGIWRSSLGEMGFVGSLVAVGSFLTVVEEVKSGIQMS